MGTPTIIKGKEYFNTVVYEGNGGGQRVGRFVPFTGNPSIANSVIFNSADSAKLERTPSSNGSGTTFTISFWFKPTKLATTYSFFDNAPGGSAVNIFSIIYNSDNTILIHGFDSGGSFSLNLATNRTFEDTSKFYHFLVAVDTTQGTSTNRVKFYVDGDQVTSLSSTTYPAQDATYGTNQTSVKQAVGYYPHNSTRYLDGYIAEFNLIDGTALTPSTFGQTDTSTGRWIPKTITGVTYGTNGVRLTFADSSAFGDDTSGNGNDLTATNLASTDQTTDSPTQNHATMSPSRKRGSLSLSEGNLKMVSTTTDYAATIGTLRLSTSGTTGFYCECKQVGSRRDAMSALIMKESVNVNGLGNNQSYTGTVGIKTRGSGGSNQYWYTIDGNEEATTGVSHALNDYVQIAVKQGKVWIGINNTWLKSGDPANGTNPLFENPFGNEDFRIMFVTYQNNDLEINFGQKSFNYTPPTGFVALQQDNLPETDKGISSLVWAKNRDNGNRGHQLYDSSRGPLLTLYSNGTNAESTNTDSLQKFLKGGFSAEDFTGLNEASESHVAWNWVANKGTTASNSNGSITSTVQANTTAGFSIVQYTGTGSAATIGHGLSSAPEWIMVKNLSQGDAWKVYHHKVASDPQTDYLVLNTTAALVDDATVWNDTAPTSSVFSIGNHTDVNTNTENYIAYCWHGVDGFSKFGIYSGNNNANGPFIQTNFKPAFVLFKDIDNTRNWTIIDSARDTFNPADKGLFPNDSAAEATGNTCDLLSNGFKPRTTGTSINASAKYIYMAFAEAPFIGDGVSPVTAR
jgi:hypothetical protein